VGLIHDMIADCLAAEIECRSKWDEAPGLYFLYLEAARPRLSQVPLPDGVWGPDRPPAVLASMADDLTVIGGLLREVAPEGLHGTAFRCESWMVDGGRPGTERRSEVTAASMAKRLHLHPDRVEIRNMYAVDRAGITYAAVQRRGSSDVERTVLYPGSGKGGFTGTIPSALDQLVTALLGVPLPARTRPAH